MLFCKEWFDLVPSLESASAIPVSESMFSISHLNKFSNNSLNFPSLARHSYL